MRVTVSLASFQSTAGASVGGRARASDVLCSSGGTTAPAFAGSFVDALAGDRGGAVGGCTQPATATSATSVTSSTGLAKRSRRVGHRVMVMVKLAGRWSTGRQLARHKAVSRMPDRLAARRGEDYSVVGLGGRSGPLCTAGSSSVGAPGSGAIAGGAAGSHSARGASATVPWQRSHIEHALCSDDVESAAARSSRSMSAAARSVVSLIAATP